MHLSTSSLTLILALGAISCHAHAQDHPSPEVAPFAVHEWGLVRYIGGAQADVSTSGYGYYPNVYLEADPNPDWGEARPAKPLIYFHPLEGFDPATTIDVTITINGGRLREIWPLAAPLLDVASYTWENVTIQEGVPCGADGVPTVDAFPCSALTDGGVCESAELRAYLTPVPHCLVANGVGAPVLLYNGFGPEPAPITIAGTVVTNTSAQPLGRTWVMSPGAIFNNGARFHAIPALGAGESVDIQTIPTITHATMVGQLQDALQTMGLTETESRHFIGAWSPDLLNVSNYSLRAIGLYDRAAVDAAYPLVMDPMPAEVVRAIAFSLQ